MGTWGSYHGSVYRIIILFQLFNLWLELVYFQFHLLYFILFLFPWFQQLENGLILSKLERHTCAFENFPYNLISNWPRLFIFNLYIFPRRGWFSFIFFSEIFPIWNCCLFNLFEYIILEHLTNLTSFNWYYFVLDLLL